MKTVEERLTEERDRDKDRVCRGKQKGIEIGPTSTNPNWANKKVDQKFVCPIEIVHLKDQY